MVRETALLKLEQAIYLITVPSSLEVILPSPSLSKREKASLNSAICSSLSCSTMVKCSVLHACCVTLVKKVHLTRHKHRVFFLPRKLRANKNMHVLRQEEGKKARKVGEEGAKVGEGGFCT